MSPTLLYDGCWGTGKTRILAEKALAMAWYYPNNKCCLIRRKRQHLKSTTWRVLTDELLPPSWVVRRNDTELYRKLKNGSELFGVGLDSVKDVTILASHQYGFMGIEEAREIRENQFEEQIVRCLRLPNVPIHQAMLVTNPDDPGHWINQRFWVKRLSGYSAIKGTMLKHLLPRSYLNRVEQLTGIFKQRYRDGLWVGTEGMVYGFDPSKHLIKRFAIPKGWRRVVAVDWGWNNAFVCKWYVISDSDYLGYPAGSWFMYREIYYTHRTVNDHAVQVLT
jgi:phage terminase large subunit